MTRLYNNSRPEESSIPEDQDTRQQLTDQFISANNMERLERPSQLYPPARLSPTKYLSGTEPTCGPGGKRDSGLSCLSSGASPPGRDCSMSGVKGASAENIFFKGLQSDHQSERPRYLQQTPGNGSWGAPRVEEHPAARVSVAGRPSVGPVWQAPEKKKSQSPPPPPPPLRSDSFAATKVFPYSEGPIGSVKGKGRSVEKLTESNNQNCLRPQTGLSASEARQSFPHLPTKDFLHPTLAADHNHNQLHPNKLFSLSSNDVRQSHHIHAPPHQRQYSDESPHYLQTRSAPPTKIQSVGSYYRSLQDLPTNTFGHKQVRHSTASMASFAANPNLENGGHKRYYGIAGKHLVQNAELQARQCKAEGRRGETEKLHWVNSNEPAHQSSLKMNRKAKYSLPPFQTSYSESKERNGHSQLGNGLHYDHQTLEHSVPNRSPEDASKKGKGDSNDSTKQFSTHHSNDHKVSHPRHQDPWVPQEDHRITALKTPLLHSLAQESKTLTERQSTGVAQEASNATGTCSAKTNRRSDRYATTLRNEIQQKRAQLQKSRSAATLTCDVEDEDAEEWRSTKASASSGVSSYKNHLKEMQARVLQATSFQRRDLEPFGPEPAAVRTSNGRVRGRKRLPLAKRTHSFSEPDKIDKVGVEGEAQTGSFGERRKFFEAKPAFSRPVLKSSQGSNLNADPGEAGKPKDRTTTGEVKEMLPSTDLNRLSPGNKQVLLEQQRLGTFAEYQATWNKQKKSSEAKTQGRYHSAENILDADAEEKAACVHERSRSSPSADFYTQVRSQGRRTVNNGTVNDGMFSSKSTDTRVNE